MEAKDSFEGVLQFDCLNKTTKYELFRVGALRVMVISPLGLKEGRLPPIKIPSTQLSLLPMDLPKQDCTFIVPIIRDGGITNGYLILHLDGSMVIGGFDNRSIVFGQARELNGISTPFTLMWSVTEK